MRKLVAFPLIVIASLIGAPMVPPLAAEQAEGSQCDVLLPPRVDRIATRAALLYAGMQAAEVEWNMGAAADDGAAGNVGVLGYPREPIPTKVTVSEGKVVGVALDVAGIDERALPAYSRSAWLGMHRIAVLRTLGAPADERVFDCFGMKLEHLVFAQPGQGDVSIFLIGERVAAKKAGRDLPPDIFGFALPIALDPVAEETDARGRKSDKGPIRVGMMAGEARAFFGAPKLSVPSSFKGRPVEYALFETTRDGSFVRMTFIAAYWSNLRTAARRLLARFSEAAESTSRNPTVVRRQAYRPPACCRPRVRPSRR